MLTLCPNCIKPTLKLSSFKQLWKCSKVVRTPSDISGNVQKCSKNCQKSSEAAGMFCEIPVTTRRTQKEVSCL